MQVRADLVRFTLTSSVALRAASFEEGCTLGNVT